MSPRSIEPYSRHTPMREIINDNNQLLMVISRFSMSLGFADKTVEQVCRENGVDVNTFLAVINMKNGAGSGSAPISLSHLVAFLRRSHKYFLENALPNIKKTLIEGIQQTSTPEIALVILRFFDRYMKHVASHMEYEDREVFPYVESLLAGDLNHRFTMTEFTRHHEHMAGSLNDLMELFIYRYDHEDNEMMSMALLLILTTGRDLVSHCDIENKLLFPAVKELEENISSNRPREKESPIEQKSSVLDTLTDREKEVIAFVAQGLPNKEIADRMCLSFHTVTTYRKNISSKLNIHSTAGITIFAIMHRLIEIDKAQNLN